MLPLIVGGAAANILSGAIGNIFSSGDKQKAFDLAEEAYQEIEAMGAPPDLAREIILEKYKQAGLYSPELEQAVDVGISEVSKIQEDPRLKEAQMNALGELEERGKLGITAEERAEMNKVRRQAGQDIEGRRQRILSSFQERGLSTPGLELAAQLQNAQAGANLESENADRIAAEASRRALESIVSSGNLGSKIREQDFNIANSKAQAVDELNRFNVSQQIARQQRNIASKNEAQGRNLSEAQRIQDLNATQRNQELVRQRQAEEEKYRLGLEQAKSKANAKLGQAGLYGEKARDTASTIGGVGAGISQGISTIGNYQNYQNYLESLKQRKLAKE